MSVEIRLFFFSLSLFFSRLMCVCCCCCCYTVHIGHMATRTLCALDSVRRLNGFKDFHMEAFKCIYYFNGHSQIVNGVLYYVLGIKLNVDEMHLQSHSSHSTNIYTYRNVNVHYMYVVCSHFHIYFNRYFIQNRCEVGNSWKL